MAKLIKEHAEKLRSERRCASRVDATLAALLVQMGFSEDRSVCAVNANHRSIASALDYLRETTFEECTLCSGECSEENMAYFEPCQHKACKTCVARHLATQSQRGRAWACFQCPIELDRHQTLNKLKPLLTRDEWERLNRETLERYLEDDPEFRRCPAPKCECGFMTDPGLQKAQCPECSLVMCNSCSSPWRREHENVTCEAFREWKRCNDPDDPDYQAEEYIRINGIKCPNCEASFVVAKGGCAHLTCPKCKCEFCESCRSEFTKGTKCVVGEACQKKGFHAHHPRNCFFYTRDYPLEHLVNLLREASVPMEDDLPADDQTCFIMLTGDDGDESKCPGKAHKNGRCEQHYKEYLCALVIRKNVDTVSLMNTAQMKEELRKNNLSLPEFAEGTAEDVVRARLVQLIKDKLPLSGRPRSGAQH